MCFAISYSQVSIEERFWQFGMGMAIALAFAVTALSFEEVEALIHSLQAESSSRLTNLLHLDEKLKVSEEKLHEELETLKRHIQDSQIEIKEKDSQIQKQEKLIEIVRNEFSATQAQHESLLSEIFQKRHEVERLNERIQAYLKQIEQLTTRSLSKIAPEEMEHLVETIRNRETSLAELHQELKKVNQDLIGIEAEKDRAQLEWIKQKALLEEKESGYQQSAYHLNETVDNLRREKSLLEASLSRLQMEFEAIQTKELACQEEIKELSQNRVQLEKALTELQASKGVYEFDLASLRKRLEEKETDLSKVQNVLLQITYEIAQLKAENIHLNELKKGQESDFELLKSQTMEKTAFIEQLQSQIAEIARQVEGLQGENQVLTELNSLKAEQDIHVESLKKQALEKAAIIEELQNQLSQTDQEMTLLQAENQSLQRELKILQEVDFELLQRQVREKSTNVEGLQARLMVTDREIAQLKQENASLRELEGHIKVQEAHFELAKKHAAENEHALAQIQERLARADETIATLAREKETLIAQLAQTAQQTDRCVAEIPQEMIEADRSFRRMKGLYEQLKCQFAEKSAILDETRKELFHLEEKFMQQQLEIQEKEIFGYSDVEKALEKHLFEMQATYVNRHRETVQEVESLYEIIDSLMKQKV